MLGMHTRLLMSLPVPCANAAQQEANYDIRLCGAFTDNRTEPDAAGLLAALRSTSTVRHAMECPGRASCRGPFDPIASPGRGRRPRSETPRTEGVAGALRNRKGVVDAAISKSATNRTVAHAAVWRNGPDE